MWDELVSAAILGTANKPLRLDAESPALEELLGGLDLSEPDASLLAMAGAVSIWQAAGASLQRNAKPLAEPCELDTLPALGRRPSHYLSLLLQGHHKELLPEFLTAAAARAKRVSPELLPALLDSACNDRRLAGLARAVMGRRGEWLALKQTKWRTAFSPIDETVWDTGGKDERMALLVELRGVNPARGRELVASTWSGEPPKDKTVFLSAFEDGLGPEDQPFLEEALADKSVEVRRQATNLLSQLGGSRLAKAIAELAASMVSFKKRLLGKPKLEIDFPEDIQKRLKDSKAELTPVPAAGAFKSLGEKARILYQLVSATAPAFWSERFAVKPEEFIEASANSEWDQAIFGGLITAAGRRVDAAWNEAILKRYISRWAEKSNLAPFPPEALRALSNKVIEALVAAHLGNAPGPSESPGVWMLSIHRRPWSESLIRNVIQTVKQNAGPIQTNPALAGQLFSAMRAGAIFIPVRMADEVCSALSIDFAEMRWLQKQADDVTSILRFRRDMLSAIESEG
jgi:hypothetical protein